MTKAAATASDISVDAILSEADIRWLDAQSQKYPDVARAQHGGVAKWMRARFQKVIEQGGGAFGVPPFAPKAKETLIMHGRRPFGGSIPVSKLARMWISAGGRQMVGIPDKMAYTRAFGESLQTAETRPLRWGERRFWHARGAAYDKLRPMYSRPARPLVAPFAAANAAPFAREYRARMLKHTATEAAVQRFRSKAAARKAAARARRKASAG